MNEKMYELSVQKKNFEVFFEIHQNYDLVIDRLSDDFWKFLKLYIIKKKSKIISNVELDQWCISVYVKNWNNFYLYLEWTNDDRMIIGVYNEKIRSSKSNRQALLDPLFSTQFESPSDNDKLCIFKVINEDFTKFSNLQRLIPENREAYCNEIYSEILDLIKSTNSTIVNWPAK